MIEFENISRSFFGVEVLKGVSFRVEPGHILGVVGENGAGKSTLMNILGGILRPTSGRMRLNAQPYSPISPRDAAHAGIAFIHQELNLFTNLSIAENIFLRRFPRRVALLPLIARRQMRERTAALLQDVHLAHPPDIAVERLSAGERQLVEIAKALAFDARLIIFDEPTTSLSTRETERLFAIMGRLRQRGISMIFISHNLGHVLRLADELVVLRDGSVVASGPKSEFDVERLISLMVGREITQLYPPRVTPPSEEVLFEARNLMQPCITQDVSFEIRQGEILGISGLMGSGRSELARILFGLDPCAKGEILLAGQPIHHLTPRERVQRGLAFVTEDRRAEGLCLDASIGENIALVALRRFTRNVACLLDRPAVTRKVRQLREAVKLTAAAPDAQAVRTLSGGNQQKVVLAKWLLNTPRVFILDEPTRGIDVGAKEEVYRLILDLASQGAGVLMISSEIEELIGTCHRILVMRAGKIRDCIRPPEFDRERILRAAIQPADMA